MAPEISLILLPFHSLLLPSLSLSARLYQVISEPFFSELSYLFVQVDTAGTT